MSSNASDDLRKILKEDPEWRNLCFMFIRPWKELDVNNRRRVWLNVFGVPLHAWGDNFSVGLETDWGKLS